VFEHRGHAYLRTCTFFRRPGLHDLPSPTHLARYERVETIAFDYRQRHNVELEARLNVLREIKARFPQWAAKLRRRPLAGPGSAG